METDKKSALETDTAGAATAVTYRDAGVDIDEGARAVSAIGASVRETYRPEVVGDLGGFGGVFSLAAAKNMEDPLLVSGTDGVGTKLELAKRAGLFDTVGIDLVAMCVNDILALGAEPLFFLDYIAIGKLRAEFVAKVVAGIAEGCKQAGCALIGGEMAEHPGVMAVDDFDLSGFCVGIVDRPRMIGTHLVSEGDVLLGLASSGFHSNGYSLIRKVCLTPDAPALDETVPELEGRSLGEALLAPTRIYVKSILDAMAAVPGGIHGVAHITGGGITENLNRILSDSLNAQVRRDSWEVPSVIRYVCNRAGLNDEEAYKTFNMGVGMVCACNPSQVDEVERSLKASGETVYRLGSIVPGTGVVEYL